MLNRFRNRTLSLLLAAIVALAPILPLPGSWSPVSVAEAACSRVTTWTSGQTLTASALNSEFNNIIDNFLSCLSPLTGNLAAGSNKITGLAAGSANGDSIRYDEFSVSHDADGTPKAGSSFAHEEEKLSSSGATVTFTGIPAGVDEIVISFQEVSSNGADSVYVRLGDSGGVENTGYVGGFTQLTNAAAVAVVRDTTQITLQAGDAARELEGVLVLHRISGNRWAWSMQAWVDNAFYIASAGRKETSAELTQIEFSLSGAGNFDAGRITLRAR